MNGFLIPILNSETPIKTIKLMGGVSLLDLNNKDIWSKKVNINSKFNIALLININKNSFIDKENICIESILDLVGLFMFIKTKKTMEFENGYEVKIINNKIWIKNTKEIDFFKEYGYSFLPYHRMLFGNDRKNYFNLQDFESLKKGLKFIHRYFYLIKSQVHPLDSTPLGVCMNSFASAYSSYMNDDIKLILTITALESLFSISSQELTHKLCHNISFFMYPSNRNITERLSFYKRVKKIYSLRSTIVHGANVEVKPDEYDDTEYLFCEVIQKMIENYNNEEIFSNKKLHQTYIQYLELGFLKNDILVKKNGLSKR